MFGFYNTTKEYSTGNWVNNHYIPKNVKKTDQKVIGDIMQKGIRVELADGELYVPRSLFERVGGGERNFQIFDTETFKVIIHFADGNAKAENNTDITAKNLNKVESAAQTLKHAEDRENLIRQASERRATIQSVDLSEVPLNQLGQFQNVKKITIPANFTKAQILEVIEQCPRLTSFHAPGNPHVDDEVLIELAKRPIEILNLQGCQNVTSLSVKLLGLFEKLKVLNLANTTASLTNLEIALLSSLPLEDLNLSGLQVNNSLAELKNLRKLDISNSRTTNDGLLRTLHRHPALQELNISRSRVTAQGISSLLASGTKVKKLNVTGTVPRQQVDLIYATSRVIVIHEDPPIRALAASPDLAERVETYFIDRSQKVTTTANFKPILVNGVPYHAYGPKYYAGQEKKGMEEYFSDIFNLVKPTVVVNLIAKEEPGNYLQDEAFKAHFETARESDVRDTYTQKRGKAALYNIKNWNDADVPSEKTIDTLLGMAQQVTGEIARGQPVFVHCRQGLQRTSAFIAMCELVRLGPRLREMSNDQLRMFVVRTLEQLAETDNGRFPTQGQLQLLLSDEFLNRVSERAGRLPATELRHTQRELTDTIGGMRRDVQAKFNDEEVPDQFVKDLPRMQVSVEGTQFKDPQQLYEHLRGRVGPDGAYNLACLMTQGAFAQMTGELMKRNSGMPGSGGRIQEVRYFFRENRVVMEQIVYFEVNELDKNMILTGKKLGYAIGKRVVEIPLSELNTKTPTFPQSRVIDSLSPLYKTREEFEREIKGF